MTATVSTTTTTDRGIAICRGCRAEALESVLDLKAQPIANELLLAQDSAEECFPLHLRICRDCGLGQVGEFVLPERIYQDYPYLSSVSTSWVQHARSYTQMMYRELNLAGGGGSVVEIASNDGYLLRGFKDLGVPAVGVEPSGTVAAIARGFGINTISSFFGRATAAEILDQYGSPRLMIANNVLAHVPDIDDFMGGMALLADDNTVITVENPSFLTLLQQNQFDTIYQEHYSYLSAHAVQRMAAAHGLELVRVDELPTHGGSYRYWLARVGCMPIDSSAAATIAREISSGLLSPRLWSQFSAHSYAAISGVRKWLEDWSAEGVRVAGYGAAAKGNTLLNAAGIGTRHLSVVADGSPEKQGKYLPGTRIPIVAPAQLAHSEPDEVLILPWNIASEIVPILSDIVPGARAWIAIPSMQIARG